MRRYLQGTLDFACGIYAVINALACTHGLELAEAKRLFQDAQLGLAARPALWACYARNETDHYWLVRLMLSHVQASTRLKLELNQPFSRCLLPSPACAPLAESLEAQSGDFSMYLPEEQAPQGPAALSDARKEALSVWQALAGWFTPEAARQDRRAVVLRFHRFLPGFDAPVVSHWTTGAFFNSNSLVLHDASSEPRALRVLERPALLPPAGRALVRIVPESLLFLRKA